MNTAMEKGCGVFRRQETMHETVATLAPLQERAKQLSLEDSSKVFNTEIIAALELANMLDVAQAVATSAADRKESRGAHTCRDFTARDDQNYLYHTLCYHEPSAPRLGKKPVKLGHWEPVERKY